MKKFIEEFKEFAIGGNLLDMAVGIIVGGAFNSIVSSLVADIFTPAIGMLMGSEVDFSEIQLGDIAIGKFINAVVSFLITALCLFLVVKAINTAKKLALKKKEDEAAAAPAPAEPVDIQLLKEIRDLLKDQKKK